MKALSYSDVMKAAAAGYSAFFVINGNNYQAGEISRASVLNGVKLGYHVLASVNGELYKIA